jgi:hypothetical protein
MPYSSKVFRLHWTDGTFTDSSGVDPGHAFSNAGYGYGAVKALDWIEAPHPNAIVWKRVGETEILQGTPHGHTQIKYRSPGGLLMVKRVSPEGEVLKREIG